MQSFMSRVTDFGQNVVIALAACLAFNVLKCTGLINIYVRCRY